jgi:hypothetical protein
VTYNPERDGPLRSGACGPEDEYAQGITPAHAARIADAINAEERRYGGPATMPESTGRSGVPQGYGKWGDLA